MKITTVTNAEVETRTAIVLIDPDYKGNYMTEKLIALEELNADEAGSAHLFIDETNDLIVKRLVVTTGTLSDFNESTGNIAKVADAIIAYMKGKNNKTVYLETENQAVMECGITALSKALISSSYEFSLVPKTDERELQYLVEDKHEASVQDMLFTGVAIGEALNYTKRLGDLPSNVCTPRYMAERSVEDFKDLPVKIGGFTEKEAEEKGMGGFVSVSVGSEEMGHVIEFEYNGGEDGDKEIVLVGKAVTFDSGGISIKPSSSMEEMKYDMCGGATVFGIIKAAATLGIKKNIRGIVGAVENMPSGKATKPGDIITMMSGKTVEVNNTDAEGRMVLADLLTYVGEEYNASTVIDFATLTGACCVALGDHAAGMFTNNETLADSLYASGQKTNDKCWRLPMWEEYNKQMDGSYADITNTGSKGGGASTAACFLNRFASDYDYAYAHMDIAGVAWSKKATGRPVSMMIDFLLHGGH